MSTDAHDIDEAKFQLARIIERVERGEEIVINRTGIPVAKVVPLSPRANRTARGSLAGRIQFAGDWDSEEVNQAVADDFGIERT